MLSRTIVSISRSPVSSRCLFSTKIEPTAEEQLHAALNLAAKEKALESVPNLESNFFQAKSLDVILDRVRRYGTAAEIEAESAPGTDSYLNNLRKIVMSPRKQLQIDRFRRHLPPTAPSELHLQDATEIASITKQLLQRELEIVNRTSTKVILSSGSFTIASVAGMWLTPIHTGYEYAFLDFFFPLASIIGGFIFFLGCGFRYENISPLRDHIARNQALLQVLKQDEKTFVQPSHLRLQADWSKKTL